MSAEKGLLLTGASGVGKTHLAVAALKELIARGHAGLFCDYRELLKEIQSSYNPSSESTEMSILEPVRTVEILVMDDLGASKPSAWVLDIIGLVLNARYNEKRVTILTTNYFDECRRRSRSRKGPRRQARLRPRRHHRRPHRRPHAFPPLRNVPHRKRRCPRFPPRSPPIRPRHRAITGVDDVYMVGPNDDT